ncbi:SIR2 family protein [Leptothrix ochracea]|uniref:SIR2 family protein n=1 Tax=Leptothrix ochracea TaxID=735331 RepID=UPI0034E2516E
MQFVQHGPDIPDALLQAHEEGRVVFFCGAGISCPAGLPLFETLVDRIYKQVGDQADTHEKELIESKQFDQTIGHLETRIQGSRENVRRGLPKLLSPDLSKPHALTTHLALLTLGKHRNGTLRLVTTNFETLFEMAQERHMKGHTLTIHPEPPARQNWDGLVHLHGRMPTSPSVHELDRLVLSDGDFGQAYLTQGWAARFVATLLRDYTLCFVGYSIDDPVMRYMTAAHALDGAQNMYAFANQASEPTDSAREAWRAKKVQAIFYDEAHGHRKLHQTLHVWASLYRDGVRGKERLVTRYAHKNPAASTCQDDFVGRMLWALGDGSDLPAKRFASFEPAPPLTWLEPLSQKLPLGGHLQRWLTRHLGDPALLLWFVQHGQKHPELPRLIADKLAESEDTPSPQMRTFWRLMLSGRVATQIRSPWMDLDIARWDKRLSTEGLSLSMRHELRALLEPKIELRKAFQLHGMHAEVDPSTLDGELVLSTEHVHGWLQNIRATAKWQEAQDTLVEDFQQLLRDALELQQALGQEDGLSYIQRPSISPHPQNKHCKDWLALVDVLRDAWVALYQRHRERARHITLGWWLMPYGLFKRLALFAATHEGITPHGEWVDWLLEKNAQGAWSSDTRREAMRLLVACGAQLSASVRSRLEEEILNRTDVIDHAIWVRLAKLDQGGAQLGETARTQFESLSSTHSEWQLAADERDEFAYWSSGSWDPGFMSRHQIFRAPRQRKALADWLRQGPQKTSPFDTDNWPDICRERFFTSAAALCDLAQENNWLPDRWHDALLVWSSEEKAIQRSWRYLAPVVQGMPDEQLHALRHSASWWLEAASRKLEHHHDACLALCKRLLDLQAQDQPSEAEQRNLINHPVHQLTHALLHLWFKHELNDNDGLPATLKPIFTRLCDPQWENFRSARYLLAAHLITFFRVDEAWTRDHLLPLFHWQPTNAEAEFAWGGFLGSAPRFHKPLMVAFKTDFLATAPHYASVSMNMNYAALLIDAALDPASDVFSQAELRKATHDLPTEGLRESLHTLVEDLKSAGDQREAFWENRIQPYWQNIWPKSKDRLTEDVTREIVHLLIATGNAFPKALDTVKYALCPLEFPYFVMRFLTPSSLCSQFPRESLELLSRLIDTHSRISPELKESLDQIARAWPDAAFDQRHQRLTKIFQNSVNRG